MNGSRKRLERVEKNWQSNIPNWSRLWKTFSKHKHKVNERKIKPLSRNGKIKISCNVRAALWWSKLIGKFMNFNWRFVNNENCFERSFWWHQEFIQIRPWSSRSCWSRFVRSFCWCCVYSVRRRLCWSNSSSEQWFKIVTRAKHKKCHQTRTLIAPKNAAIVVWVNCP